MIHTNEASSHWGEVEKSYRSMKAVAGNTACDAWWGPEVHLGYFWDEYISREREKIDTMTCKYTKAL